MANILSLAVRVTGDASGLQLTPVEKALQRLQQESDKTSKIFEKFAQTSELGAKAQETFDAASSALLETLKAGTITRDEFVRQFNELEAGARATAAALAEGQRVTEANRTEEERRAIAVEKLNQLLAAGGIEQETYNRAVAAARKPLDDAAASATKTEKQVDALTKALRLLAALEIGRAVVDGLQIIGRSVASVSRQVASFVTETANSFDKFNDLADRTGIGAESLQRYSLAAQLAGVDTEAFASSVQRLTVSIGKADAGGALDKSLKEIGLSVADLRALSPEQQFDAIGKAISTIPTQADRAAAAVEVFGKQGAALAPLFADGAASFQEITERAERLGIIVDEVQLNNIGKMNDAFDLARKTVEGIAGQVIGNLAPAVSGVVEQFLQFIESFNSTDGTGGSGLATSISRVLLDAADYFAGKFDQVAAYFTGFSTTLEEVGSVFAVVTNVLDGVAASVRAVFNLLQVGVSALTAGLGKVLEAIGSYVSDDLQEFGRNLAEAADDQLLRNIRETNEAAEQAGNAFNRAIGGSNPAEAGGGAASEFMDGVRKQFEREQSPQFTVESTIDATAERLNAFLERSGANASQFLQQSVETLAVFEQQAAAGELTADQIEIMTGFTEELNRQLNIEEGARRKAADAAKAQAEQDAKRLEDLLKVSDASAKAIQDIEAVDREIARVQVAAASGADAGSSAARISELEQLRVKLEEDLEASSLGFEKGFGDAFASVGDKLRELGEKANEFGAAGSEAFRKLQEGVQTAQDQVGDGILNREAFERQVEEQQQIFERELKNIKDVADERLKVNEFVDKTLLTLQLGGDSQRAEAAQKVVEIEQEILRIQDEVQAARKSGENDVVQAGVARLAQLDQVLTAEQRIASGQTKLEEELRKQQKETAKQQQQAATKANEERKKAFEEQAKAQAKENERVLANRRQLATASNQAAQGADIRTSEGANAFIQAVQGGFDPQLAVQRQQLKVQQRIAVGLEANLNALGFQTFRFPAAAGA